MTASLIKMVLLVGCGDAPPPSEGSDTGRSATIDPERETTEQDIITTHLDWDLSTGQATAGLTVAPHEGAGFVRLEAGGLEISNVEVEGEDPQTELVDGLLYVSAADHADLSLTVSYTIANHDGFDGWMPEPGVSFLWPTFCGNLFPCDSDPADGVAFSLSITGVEDGQVAIYPKGPLRDAPSYMPALAVGDYTELVLGSTTSGTLVSAWVLPGGEEDAAVGTEDLVAVFDFLETTYGPYAFGEHVGSVSADWGGGDYGGMEHHPYWHVSSGSMYKPETHAHEAAHGWYGDGVRIACWEDFVLSEGTVTYMAARALEEVGGADLWPETAAALDLFCGSAGNTVALPDTCGAIDILTDPLWSLVPYKKGACFYEEVGDIVGFEALDKVLSDFYQTHVGHAATMQQMLDALVEGASDHQALAIQAAAQEWLLQLACPEDYVERCGSHGNAPSR